MKKLILLVAILAILAGCKEPAIQTKVTDINGIKLELLFEHDGCKMYRFTDYHTIYWSDCRGRTEYTHTSKRGNTSTTNRQQTVSE
ncbi:hypothetical protein [Sphingobacterium yanglingense]|uniref:DUF4884 domain-containing protein n=1 Tax=Sphingobacterium yanglingense TaxID=1437280 RepID=A0A4V3DE44_9SPHI|nr:hypothetical protein [Sphingobacterium yanglingense]TDQ79569.1 hypothetical protein CLV99_1014 [Sphingobacterium yanglingense]